MQKEGVEAAALVKTFVALVQVLAWGYALSLASGPESCPVQNSGLGLAWNPALGLALDLASGLALYPASGLAWDPALGHALGRVWDPASGLLLSSASMLVLMAALAGESSCSAPASV